MNLPVKIFFSKKFWTKKLPLVLPPSICFVLVLSSTSLFPRRSFIPGVLGGRAMADDFSRDPDAAGRGLPYLRQPLPDSASETRFWTSPHLTALVLSHDHMLEVLRGERVVTTPPPQSPLAPWLRSGNPEDFEGPILISWVFFRHMTLRDAQGAFTYQPQFYVRVASEGVAPFTMQMTAEWHGQANQTMALPARGRSVRHVPIRWVLPVLLLRGQREDLTLPEWECEVFSQEVIISRHCLRGSTHVVGRTLNALGNPFAQPDFGAPSS